MTISDPSSKPIEGEPVWIHVKTGHPYKLLMIALNEADLSAVVIYTRADKSGPAWSRPAAEFFDGRFRNWEA